MFIYLITCLVNGKYYVGQTVGTLKTRWSCHVSHALGYCNNTILPRAIRKYGPENFKMEVLCECPDQDSLDKAEIFFVWLLAANKRSFGYNITEGGKGAGSALKEMAAKKRQEKETNRRWLDYYQFKQDRKKRFDAL